MPELHVISSAVVAVRPGLAGTVAERIAALPMTEVRASSDTRIVAILEGRSRGEVGARLTEIALMDGVVSANMVFEHVDEGDEEVLA